MMREIFNGIWTWSWLSEEKGYNFNGTLVCEGDKKILIDPILLERDDYDFLKGLGKFDAIYLTNKDHERISCKLRKELGIPILIHEEDKKFMNEKPDYTFRDHDELLCGIEVIHFKDQKSPGESAFYLPKRKMLIVGDALIGDPPGSLNTLPSTRYRDFGNAKSELVEKLYFLPVDSVLVGDGEHILTGAGTVLKEFFNSTQLLQIHYRESNILCRIRNDHC